MTDGTTARKEELVEQPGLPRPYLTEDEIRERCQILGFDWPDDQPMPVDTPEGRKRFQALIELMGGAIAAYTGVDQEDGTFEQINQEYQEFGEEYLVG